ncbi:MAG: hypothetical protein IPL88_04105 [Rhizobiales bacterium]|nr:hypothetical protein [Hyphomicrobiales bacterium]
MALYLAIRKNVANHLFEVLVQFLFWSGAALVAAAGAHFSALGGAPFVAPLWPLLVVSLAFGIVRSIRLSRGGPGSLTPPLVGGALAAAAVYVAARTPNPLHDAFTRTIGLTFSDTPVVTPCGHYLCTIGANGHPGVVRPVRMGWRRGETIVCTRQLLIANAFEELIAERWPGLHGWIRPRYDAIGRVAGRYYGLFAHKWVCDLVYLAMKPAEWAFLLTLRLLDPRAEERIARQYAPPAPVPAAAPVRPRPGPPSPPAGRGSRPPGAPP